MIKTNNDFSAQVEQLGKELEKFSKNLQNNINVTATRFASNQVKDAVHKEDMKTIGDIKKTRYEKNLKKSEIRLKKRRRTRLGWERFSISIKADEQNLYWYNIINNSKAKPRWTKKHQKRGVLKKDDFLNRSFEKSYKKALLAYTTMMRLRINNDAKKISQKVANKALKVKLRRM